FAVLNTLSDLWVQVSPLGGFRGLHSLWPHDKKFLFVIPGIFLHHVIPSKKLNRTQYEHRSR
ncbi:MAG: hypothetical protein ACOCWZ_08610, partial [Spirochaetota bacterium]